MPLTDSTIFSLSRDVMIIYDRYFDRLGKYKLSRMQDEASDRVIDVSTEPSSRPPVIQNPPVDATPALKTLADNGDPITILVGLIAVLYRDDHCVDVTTFILLHPKALACSGLAPAKFCSWAYITAFSPDDIERYSK